MAQGTTKQRRHEPWDIEAARLILKPLQSCDGAMLPMLHALQAKFGFIHADAIELVADALNVSRAEVHGVVSFYHDFRTTLAAALVVRLCRAEACQAAGASDAASALLQRLGLGWNEPAPDNALVVEPVYCLGLCAAAPAALIGETLLARFDGDTLAKAVSDAQ